MLMRPEMSFSFFFFNDTATTEIYTLSLHDALPISEHGRAHHLNQMKHEIVLDDWLCSRAQLMREPDRKSTRLNSSHSQISYAVFCLKKKKNVNICLLNRICTSHCDHLATQRMSSAH